jgi:hypothetical protein
VNQRTLSHGDALLECRGDPERISSHEHYSSSHSKTLRAAMGCSVWFAGPGRTQERRIERFTGQHCAARGKSQGKTRRVASAGNWSCDRSLREGGRMKESGFDNRSRVRNAKVSRNHGSTLVRTLLTGLIDPPCHPLTSPDALASTASRPPLVTTRDRPRSRRWRATLRGWSH